MSHRRLTKSLESKYTWCDDGMIRCEQLGSVNGKERQYMVKLSGVVINNSYILGYAEGQY